MCIRCTRANAFPNDSKKNSNDDANVCIEAVKKSLFLNAFLFVVFSDAELERIRQRALNSMIQNQQHRRESTEKKILIPLNEESSEEEEDDISLSSNDLVETRKDQPLQV